MNLSVYVFFGEALAKHAAAIPREFGGGISRSGRRPIRAAKLLAKQKQNPGFPPSKEDDPSTHSDPLATDARDLARVDYMPASSIVSGS